MVWNSLPAIQNSLFWSFVENLEIPILVISLDIISTYNEIPNLGVLVSRQLLVEIMRQEFHLLCESLDNT